MRAVLLDYHLEVSALFDGKIFYQKVREGCGSLNSPENSKCCGYIKTIQYQNCLEAYKSFFVT